MLCFKFKIQLGTKKGKLPKRVTISLQDNLNSIRCVILKSI